MSNLLNFTHKNFGKVRMVTINGQPYAIAKDVAKALGYKNTNDAINKHCKGVVKHDGFKIGGNMASLIPQGDIIRLAIKCPLPEADKFESWIFDEVIPSVLNDGAYVMGASEKENRQIARQFKESKYLTEEIHDRKSIRKYIRNYNMMKLDECIDAIAEMTMKMKGSIKHDLLDVAIKELKAIDDGLMKDTIKHTYIKDTATEGIITLQDVKIGKYKRKLSTLC